MESNFFNVTHLHPLTVGAPGHGDHQAEEEKAHENPTKVRMRLCCFHCFTTCALSHYSRPSAAMSVIKPYQALAASSSGCTSAQHCTEVTSGETLCRDNCQLIGMPFFHTRSAGKNNRN